MPLNSETGASREPEAPPDSNPRASERRSSSERLSSLGRLAAGVAHEINNPLSYVLGSIELLERALAEIGSLHPDAARTGQIVFDAQAAIENAKDGVERIRIIVRDLTTFSHPSPETRGSVNVERIVDGTLELAWNDLRHRLRVVKSFAAVPESLGDESRLAHVFLTLMLNAAHSVPKGRQGVLRISTFSEGQAVCVAFEDDGVGIRSEDLPYVFEPFFEVHGPSDGSGLGLSICRNIVTALGGTITVTAGSAAGSRFTVTLPAPEARAASDEGKQPRSRKRVNGRARILIIDDEPLLGQTLRFAFQDKHDVEVASSGREALERLARDADFDLVLCDLMMPDVSGEHVYRALNERAPELLPRFVFMTGGAFTEHAQEFLAQFAGRQLEKPFNIDEVETLISELTVGSA